MRRGLWYCSDWCPSRSNTWEARHFDLMGTLPDYLGAISSPNQHLAPCECAILRLSLVLHFLVFVSLD